MNIFDFPAHPFPDELTTILAEKENIRVERIVSSGHTSDWYDQAETEFVALLDGSAVIEYENGATIAMSRGDTLIIPPHAKHRVSYTSSDPPCIWLCVFY